MSRSVTWSAALAPVLIAGALFTFAGLAQTAHGVTATQRVIRDSAALQQATDRLNAARSRSTQIDRQVNAASGRLDEIIVEQDKTAGRLNARARSMYRSGDAGFIELLLGADTFEEFAARWDLLTRMNEEDALDLELLAKLRREANAEASRLLKLQERQARAVTEEAREVAQARRQLASSKAALATYEARLASASRTETTPRAPKKDSTQKLTGRGAWKTALASHYSRTFTGRGASGARIGPYSMMVAHKSLPFGTLIEFEYRGRRAVAKVADRGPYSGGRVFDLGPGVVRVLNFNGVHNVKYRIIGR